MVDIPIERFTEARAVIKDRILFTPVLSLTTEKKIFLKAECLQPAGSFKIRGALFALSQLPKEKLAKGVVAFSTGNHAQSVALAAKIYGIKATIVMSEDVVPFKKEATKALGGEIVIVPAAERKQFCEDFSKRTGAFFLPPFDHPDVITGQGTIGLEILDQITPAAVFVPIGGGGLIAGIAMAIKQKNPKVLMIGVEPNLEDDAYKSFKSGKKVGGGGTSNTIADAVKIGELGDLTFPVIQRYVDDIVTVSEEHILKATILSAEAAHLFVEPSGALALAGALQYKAFAKPVVCIATGGNTTFRFVCEQKKWTVENVD